MLDQLKIDAPARVWRQGGERPVLALHCSLAHSGAWAALAGHLNGVTITAIDQPGHGAAPDWDGIEDIHSLATTRATAWAEELGKGAPIDLLGHSFGGTVALRLAVERPDLVRSLTLFEPVYFVAAKADDAPEFANFIGSHLKIDERLEAGEAEQAAIDFLRIWGSGEDWASLSPRMQSYFRERMRLLVAQNPVLLHDAPGLLAPGRLQGLTCPVFLAQGSDSPPIIAAINLAMAARMPNVTCHVEQGAGHMLPITHAKTLAPLVQAHLDKS